MRLLIVGTLRAGSPPPRSPWTTATVTHPKQRTGDARLPTAAGSTPPYNRIAHRHIHVPVSPAASPPSRAAAAITPAPRNTSRCRPIRN